MYVRDRYHIYQYYFLRDDRTPLLLMQFFFFFYELPPPLHLPPSRVVERFEGRSLVGCCGFLGGLYKIRKSVLLNISHRFFHSYCC